METPQPFNQDSPPPPTPPEPPAPGPSADGLISEADRSWCIGLHLSGLSGLVLGFALAHIIVPLIIWLLKRSESPSIDATGKEVLNFQISYSIYLAVSLLLWFVCIGVPVTIGIGVAWLVLTIIAAIKTSNGENYRYPWIIRLLS